MVGRKRIVEEDEVGVLAMRRLAYSCSMVSGLLFIIGRVVLGWRTLQ
jgi:hypothetical protein